MNGSDATHVVIVGAGFGGVRTALNLANKRHVTVRLVAPQSYFEYHAALYRAATGRSPLEVAIPLKDFFEFADNVEVIEDTVTHVDTQQQHAVGGSGSVYAYDKIVLAFGNSTDYYGIPGLKEYSFGVKSIHEALRFKRHLHEQLIQQDIEQAYVVVGAGATGVELSAEMVSYLHHVREAHSVSSEFTVYLIEAAPRVLGKMPQAYAKRVEERLKQVGVELILGTAVDAETQDYIELPDKRIPSHTVVWTAGVKNNQLAHNITEVELGKLDRLHVDGYLRATDNVYVIGDAADTEFSGMAQTALNHADYVAQTITAEAKGYIAQEFIPKKPIYAVPVGAHWSAVLWGKTKVYGWLGWVLRRLADLRLYLNFLPFTKALTTWRYGFEKQEVCPVCSGK